MKRKLTPGLPKCLISLLVAVSHCLPVLAQDDSSWYDLGSTRVEKKFTQHIAIKGEDLERMPFASLSGAINVWLYGAYSNPATRVYIVDGNMVTDVNAWSIYDIEEVVLLQSALVQTSGNAGQQQFVLVTTRKKSSSFRAAG